MEMKQISDSTIKITIQLEDLEERGMEMADFLVPQEKTEEFFYTILDELEMPDNFLDSGMLSLISPVLIARCAAWTGAAGDLPNV